MARTITKKRTKISNGLIAFAAMSGLLLQMAWATAHYPMLLASLGTTESGVAVRNLVICVHRAKQQRIFDKLQKNQTSRSSVPISSQIDNATPSDPAPTNEDKNAPSDELCTFSIALTGTDFETLSDDQPLQAPITIVGRYDAQTTDQTSEGISFLSPLGRSPPA